MADYKYDVFTYIIDGSSLPEELEFTFSAINWRRIEEHSISTVLVDDILRRVGRERLQHTDLFMYLWLSQTNIFHGI